MSMPESDCVESLGRRESLFAPMFHTVSEFPPPSTHVCLILSQEQGREDDLPLKVPCSCSVTGWPQAVRTVRGREKFKGRIVALLSPSLSQTVEMILGVLRGLHEQRELQGS